MGNSVNREAQEGDSGRWFVIYYLCPCGREWSDEWSCACDSECECGRTVPALDWRCHDKCECDYCKCECDYCHPSKLELTK